MAQNHDAAETALEIDRLATQLAKDPHSKVFMPLAEEYGKAGMWQEAVGVLEDGLKLYPAFITAMVALGRAYDHMEQATKAKAILEESVKLSPENLLAHRTLIKIYASEGLNESALQSCAVILAVNPRDEDALSVQAALGGPLKQMRESKRPKPAAPGTRTRSAKKATALPAPVTSMPSTPPEDMPVSTTAEPEFTYTDTLHVTTGCMETARPTEDQRGEQLAVVEPGSQTSDTVLASPPSPQAEVVAQLEAWLRTIESRRHDRDTTNDSHPIRS
jgi:tetratricopeptide (TPR) repeat protein